MEQLIFELATPEPPSFANFLPGSNREAVARARRKFADGEAAETGLVLWGPPGWARRTCCGRLPMRRPPASGRSLSLRGTRVVARPIALPAALVLVDDVDRADGAAQGRLFTVYNTLKATWGALIAAAGATAGADVAARRCAHPLGVGTGL